MKRESHLNRGLEIEDLKGKILRDFESEMIREAERKTEIEFEKKYIY